ncbi:TPA: acetyltransferase [Vibrio cholerae]|nr:acetyltransferase [Vibrio cholerae]HCJ7281334.1 acetyltransferase [Vibrio cholerae]HCJ7319135.1 acetyltransferase [Vibrio cholerae]
MVTVVVFEFGVMRCQPLRRALCASNQKVDSSDNLISESA